MHYTSKLRVIVCNSLENISHAVHSATEPQSTELWRSKCNLKLKKKKRYRGRKEEGWRAATGCVTRSWLLTWGNG